MEIRIEYTFSPIGSIDFFSVNGIKYMANEDFRNFMNNANQNKLTCQELKFLGINDAESAYWVLEKGSHEYDGKGSLFLEDASDITRFMYGV